MPSPRPSPRYASKPGREPVPGPRPVSARSCRPMAAAAASRSTSGRRHPRGGGPLRNEHGGLDEDAECCRRRLERATSWRVASINLATAFLADGSWAGSRPRSRTSSPCGADAGSSRAWWRRGHQTLTLIVRGLALGQVERTNARWLLNKEIAVAMLNGVAWATVVAIVAMLWFRNWRIAGVSSPRWS